MGKKNHKKQAESSIRREEEEEEMGQDTAVKQLIMSPIK